MSPRAYSPRLSTVSLIAAILEVPGVASCRTIPPGHGRPTRLRITLETRDTNGRPVYDDFTLPDARAWLASEQDPVMEPGGTSVWTGGAPQ